jgi:putative flippase GtrA
MTVEASSETLRIFRFLAAGGMNTCFGYAAFAFFIWAGLPNDYAVACMIAAGAVFNYNSFGHAFSSQGTQRLPAFIGVYGALLITNIYLLRGLVSLGFGPYVGQGIIVILIAPINYLALKRFVFISARH